MNELSLIERVWNYANDIISGNILACQKHIWAVERFFKDFDDIENGTSDYYFDVNELEDFYEWALLFKHTEGVLAEKPIELTDFQLFLVANIFCWKRKKTGARKYKRVYIQLARKQAKSQLQALIASYVAFLTREKQQVYIAGVTKEQSKIVYDQMLDQIEACDFLKGTFKTTYGTVTHRKSKSYIKPLSQEARRSGDGKFPSLSIIDEYHNHQTSEVYDVLLSGMIGRKNALQVIITTAGLNLNSPCYTEYQYCSDILNPESVKENDSYFVMICEMEPDDDIKDINLYIKANPIVCTYPEGIEDLQDRLRTALDVPEKMTEFLTKHCNIWVQDTHGGYMDLKKWNDCGATKDNPFPDVYGKDVYIGIDLSSTLDLSSVSFLIPIGNEKFAVMGHSFMPEPRLKEKMRTDNVRYDLWKQQNWLTTTPEDVIDYRFIKKYIDEQVKKYNWKPKGIHYDPWSAESLINEMVDDGYKVIKTNQRISVLSNPTKHFRELVYRKLIIHDNNPLFNFAIGNAIQKKDHNENIMLDKSKAVQRIDPIASAITAHSGAMFHYQYGDINDMTSDEYLDSIGWGDYD